MPSPRRVLGVSEQATPSEIRRAFRRLVLELHPDRGGAASEARLLDVVEAYETLTGKARPARRRVARPAPTPAPARRGTTGRPYTSSGPYAESPRDRFNCGRCHDTFAIEGECPRCGIEVTEGHAVAPPLPEVEAYIHALEAQRPPPAWVGSLERRLPVATIGTLFAGGSLALTIHAPIAAMMIGYGLVLLCADAVLGRAAA